MTESKNLQDLGLNATNTQRQYGLMNMSNLWSLLQRGEKQKLLRTYIVILTPTFNAYTTRVDINQDFLKTPE